MEALVLQHAGLATSLARRFGGTRVDRQDLEQVAMLALVVAARRFDPGKGSSFAHYAATSIGGALKRHLRDHAWGIRPPRALHDRHFALRAVVDDLTAAAGRSPTIPEIAQAGGWTAEEVLEVMECGAVFTLGSVEAPSTGDFDSWEPAGDDQGIERVEQRAALAGLLRHLSPLERRILAWRFLGGLSQADIGDRLGVSQMQVSRLLARCLARLRTLAAA